MFAERGILLPLCVPLISEVRFNRLLSRAAVLPLLLMAALSGLLIWQIVNLLHVFEWVGHTDTVISEANVTQKLLLDMETGKRGYLLTGKVEYLQPYQSAGIAGALTAFRRLAAGVASDPAQLKACGRDPADLWAVGGLFRRANSAV